MDYLENRTFEEIQVGDAASLTRTLTEKDIQVFAIMSGDINPAHVDIEYAQSEMFHKIIAHGMWGGALISTVLGTQLPGPGTIYISQSLKFKRPVAIGDTLTVTVTATEKKPEKNRIIFTCNCLNQLNENVLEGQAEVIAPTKKIKRLKAVLPELSFRRPYSLFAPYLEKAKQLGALKAAIILPTRDKIIKAIHDAKLAGLMDPVLIGPKAKILAAAEAAEVDISDYDIIDIEHSRGAIAKAITMVRDNEIGLIVRGGATREDLLHAIQRHDKGIMTETQMSYAAILDVPTYNKALIITDTLVHTEPSLDVKRCITQNAINFAKSLGIETPKVAILAGSDNVNNNLRSTVDASALCKMAERGQIEGGILDGPLTFDNVISVEVARAKGISSPVIGDADILVVPNLETGSILSKQLEYLAESRNCGVVLGGKVPVLMSHINDIRLSTFSCALAILYSHYMQTMEETI